MVTADVGLYRLVYGAATAARTGNKTLTTVHARPTACVGGRPCSVINSPVKRCNDPAFVPLKEDRSWNAVDDAVKRLDDHAVVPLKGDTS